MAELGKERGEGCEWGKWSSWSQVVWMVYISENYERREIPPIEIIKELL